MKKYSITTTVNGKALVKQEHTFNTDGCTTSYGDVWAFASCTEAGKWVDSELGIISNAQRAMDAQKESSKLTFDGYKIPSDEVQQDRCNRMTGITAESIRDKAQAAIEDVKLNGVIKQDIGIEVDISQVEECVVSPETHKSLLEKIAEAEKVINE